MPSVRKRSIPRRATVDDDVVAQVEEYLLNRSMRERSSYHEDRLKRALMALLEVAGDQTETHRQTLALDIPIPFVTYKGGKAQEKIITGIERRERISNKLNEDEALALLERKGLLAECATTVVVVDEDAILAANYAGKITDKELAALYEESSTFAFYPTEETP